MSKNFSWLLCGLLLTGCSVPAFEHERTVKQTVESKPLPLQQVDLTTFNGSIEVIPHDASTVEVEINYKAYGATPEEAERNANALDCEYASNDGVLTMRASKPAGQWMAAASFKLRVPRDLAFKGKTSNGRVSVSKLTRPVEIDTSNGAITLKQITADISAATSNGTINLEDCLGKTALRTSNGQIKFSGRMIGDKNSLKTSNGTITLRIDPEHRLEIQSKTSNGKITCSLENQRVIEESKRKFHAVVGEGDPQQVAFVQIETSNGSIRIEPWVADAESNVATAEITADDLIVQ